MSMLFVEIPDNTCRSIDSKLEDLNSRLGPFIAIEGVPPFKFAYGL